METKIPESYLTAFQQAISQLAEIISQDVKPDEIVLQKILISVEIKDETWGKRILGRASEILKEAHRDLSGINKNSLIADLESLGIKKFPAILTYEKVKPHPLSVEPAKIEFSTSNSLEEANATLKVTGGVVKEISAGNRLKLNLIRSNDGNNLIKVTLSKVLPADSSFVDYVIIKSNKGDLKIPVKVNAIQKGSQLETSKNASSHVMVTPKQNDKFKSVIYKPKIDVNTEIRILIDAFASEGTADRCEALNGLKKIGIPAVNPLIQSLKSPDHIIREWSARTLGHIGDKSATSYLIVCLNDEVSKVRERAIGALEQIKDPRAFTVLKKALLDNDRYVRESAQRALRVIPRNQ